MGRQGGLGKGLGALIPQSSGPAGAADRLASDTEGDARYRELALDLISPSSYQPRDVFDHDALDSLTASIRELGVLQPVLVRVVGTGYELIAGERRWRAARAAGLTAIPAIIREVDDLTSLAQAVVENIHREDLHALEEAAAYRQLLDDFGLTHEELGIRVGKSRVAITNTLRLLQLPASVQGYVASGALSAGHARAILGCPTAIDQEEMAEEIVAEALSVRATEQAVRELIEPEASDPDDDDSETKPPVPGRVRPAALLELEQVLAEHLSTKVRIEMGANKGRMTVEFADLEDLERLYRVIQS